MDNLFETCPMAENNMRELYEIYLELGHEVFEEKIKKHMELYLHDNTNVIVMYSLNMVVANAMENLKRREVGKNCLEISPFDKFEVTSTLTQQNKIVELPNICPTISEINKTYVLYVDYEKHALCDSYIVEFVHDAT